MSAVTSPTSTAPSRTFTNGTDEEAIPGEDTSEVTKLFAERLQAWKHAVGYLEDWVTATEKANNAHGKEYEKVLKTVRDPLKEGHHFDQSLGGIAGMFENIRSNTQGLSNQHYDTAKQLKGTILPIFERLHTEIKNKTKELTKGAGKGSKAVDKARAVTQKHIQLLGQYTAVFDSSGGRMGASEDPYVLQRGVMHRLNKQIQEENNNRQDLISVQNSFAQFEAHVIQTIQHGMGQFMQIVNTQAEQTKVLYGDMVGTTQRIPLDFEWNAFIQRNNDVLIDPSAPARSVSNIHFANQNHRATQPLIAGSLERKGKIMRSYDTNYYVITPAKFLHEYKTDDDFAKDPAPEMSLYLPDCIIGGCNGNKFNVKGKDVSKGKIGNNFSLSHELQFKAHTPQAATQWWEIIRQAAGQVSGDAPEASAPTSPATGKSSPGSGAQSPVAAEDSKQPAPLQTQGLEKTDTGVTGPTPISAAPASGVGGEPGKY
ncbi:PH domain-containing protein [Corynespora cassiicola Philippines]|uniref:PH domain-containing protein n=1 Tax=Corynespora cassiicola Philippines TaxID=1448308 RepID=A0A2T2PCB4_CORCC|nr:PH domain-containing protein [Corynespora cassiicola Philippines]